MARFLLLKKKQELKVSIMKSSGALSAHTWWFARSQIVLCLDEQMGMDELRKACRKRLADVWISLMKLCCFHLSLCLSPCVHIHKAGFDVDCSRLVTVKQPEIIHQSVTLCPNLMPACVYGLIIFPLSVTGTCYTACWLFCLTVWNRIKSANLNKSTTAALIDR